MGQLSADKREKGAQVQGTAHRPWRAGLSPGGNSVRHKEDRSRGLDSTDHPMAKGLPSF